MNEYQQGFKDALTKVANEWASKSFRGHDEIQSCEVQAFLDTRHVHYEECRKQPPTRTWTRECTWKYDGIDDYYETTCGEAHCLIDGTLAENKHKFCPYFGGSIIEVRPLDSPPQE